MADILHVRLAGGIPENGGAGGHGGGHNGVFSGGNRGLVQKNIFADQLVRGQLEHAVYLDPGAQGTKGQKMGVQAPPADHIAAGGRQQHFAGSGQQGPGKQNRSPYVLGLLGR